MNVQNVATEKPHKTRDKILMILFEIPPLTLNKLKCAPIKLMVIVINRDMVVTGKNRLIVFRGMKYKLPKEEINKTRMKLITMDALPPKLGFN
ncbi:hypothetical protein J27TS8_38980 [Robertmurraya siralis]|uniref:Uncharacterized protein n=2 Tax=Robertmurraya siralis TaxID=77777 RepID=A0A920BV27_9BACI|nr:hypothetical protein J27TS8_38980 [Robertmurraya siralis]